MAQFSRRTQWIAAVGAMAAGVVVIYAIHAHPEGLRVPAWVAHMAASTFVIAGLALVAGLFELDWLQRGLGLAVTVVLLVVFAWIAFGPGERACSVSIPLMRTDASALMCRGAFGAGAVLMAVFLGLLLWRTLSGRRGGS